MSHKAITVYTPPGSQPHISADDDAFIHHSLLQGRSGILGGLVCKKSGGTSITLSGGGVSNRGYILRIPDGETVQLSVLAGTVGLDRIDLVVSRFTKGGGDIADRHELAVVTGTSAAEPHAPAVASGELLSVGDVNETPLFEIRLHGQEIASVSCVAPDAAQPVSADGFASPVTLTLTGDAQGRASIDGRGDVSVATTVPALEALTTYHMKLTSKQRDPVALVKEKWKTLASGGAFIIYISGGSYGSCCMLIGEKASDTSGCMMRFTPDFIVPTWHYLRAGVWGASVIARS